VLPPSGVGLAAPRHSLGRFEPLGCIPGASGSDLLLHLHTSKQHARLNDETAGISREEFSRVLVMKVVILVLVCVVALTSCSADGRILI
jgi:hypothetical protein